MSSKNICSLITALGERKVNFSVAKSAFEVIFSLLLGNEYVRTHETCVEMLQKINSVYRPKYLQAEVELLTVVYLKLSPDHYKVIG